MPHLLLLLLLILPLGSQAIPHDTLWVALRSGDTVQAKRINFNWNTIRGGKVKVKRLDDSKEKYWFKEVAAVQDRRWRFVLLVANDSIRNKDHFLHAVHTEGYFTLYESWHDESASLWIIAWENQTSRLNRSSFKSRIRPILQECPAILEAFGEKRITYSRVARLIQFYNANCLERGSG